MKDHTPDLMFSVIAETIKQSRYHALKTINTELVNLYWQVGAFVSKQLSGSGWGDKTVQQLSDFLLKYDPTLKGFDRKSIYRMVQFHESYCTCQFVAPLVRQIQNTDNQDFDFISKIQKETTKRYKKKNIALIWREINETDIRHSILVKTSWTNHLIIFSRCKTEEEKEFYLKMAIKEKYSKRELERQISTGLFERTLMGNRSISPALKEIHSDIANNFKDSYIFEFLKLDESHSEGDLQKGLVRQMKTFILELGKDFLFMGEEHKIQVGNSDFFIDLLFYHRGLQCLVVFELKNDKFKPDHLGQLNFYLEALDRDIKKSNENPSIGILLCKDKDKEVVEYALSRSLSPTMISEYKTQLPDKRILQRKLHEIFRD